MSTAHGGTRQSILDAARRLVTDRRAVSMADIASEVTAFRRSSFDVTHHISIGGQLAVEGHETRVWAAQDPNDPIKLKGIPIPAAVIERFRAGA